MSGISSFLKSFFSIRKKELKFINYRIKCGKCGEIVEIKVFPDRDLNPTYEDEGPCYTLRKEVMDSKCFQIMVLNAEFDSSCKELNRDISGGKFVD